MFWIKNKKIRYIPANPSFSILKWGLRGYSFPDGNRRKGLEKIGGMRTKSCVLFVCLNLMLNVPVNSQGHVGTLPTFYGTFTQSENVITSNVCLKYNHLTKSVRLIFIDGLS